MVVSVFSPFKFSFLFFAVRGYVPTATATLLSPKPSFDQYVSVERGRSDTRSLPFLRETQLYSRSSRGHLRILGRKVDVNGRDGDVYAKLIIESDNFGRVKIRGYKSSYYLCIRNKDGRLIGRKRATKSKCVFYEKYAPNSFTEFYSAFKPNWMITVSKKGTTRPSYKGRSGQKSVQFIQRPSRFIIETNVKDVGQSFIDGLSQHIAQLLRNYRSQVGVKVKTKSTGPQKRKNRRTKKKKHPKRRKNRKKGKRRSRKTKRRLRISKKKRKKELRRKRKKE